MVLPWLLSAGFAFYSPAAKAQVAGPAAAPAAAAADIPSAEEGSVELPVRLLERDPFDRITLDAANDNAVIETILLDFPERRVPNPFPGEGTLDIRRLTEPSIPYQLDWAAIKKIELFEYMLLTEAERLTAGGEYAEAFDYLSFLASNYSQLPGLENALQSHLWKEASAAYAAGNRDEAWPVLQALYLRNPQFPRLLNAVQSVSDDMISSRFDEGNYAGARAVLSVLEQSFSNLQLENVARWKARFDADAREQMNLARTALAAEEYSDARTAVTRAMSILPTIEGGEALWKQIQGSAPEIRVGVTQLGEPANPATTPTWPDARITGLTDPRLVEMVDFGAEGGVYASPWGELTTSDDGRETTLRLSPAAMTRGLTPDAVALRLVDMAQLGGPHEQEDFAALIDTVHIAGGQDVVIRWRHPNVRPEALLQAPLRWIASSERASGLWFEPTGKGGGGEKRYERTGPQAAATGEPRFIVEQQFEDDDEALQALVRGDVDVIDRVPPWQLQRMQQAEGIEVAAYRLPTVHVLIPNPANPLLESREFRRAISYGIDSESILGDILLAGETRPGFRTLSGPFPAGASLSDPVGYASNPQIPPRPYEPRLAALLSGVARQTLAKRDADARRAKEAKEAKDAEQAANESPPKDAEPQEAEAKEAAEAKPNEPPSAKPAGGAGESEEEESDEEKVPPPKPLILAHSPDPLARLACQTIKIQLDGVGIPIKLVEFAGDKPPADLKYDLLYAELAMWEPIVDARRLLGRNGLIGRTSPLMSLALDRLAQSENWNQARAQLNEIHRIAHYDLPVLPLWQTVNYFAYRKSVDGVGTNPVSLYQNLSAWRKSFE